MNFVKAVLKSKSTGSTEAFRRYAAVQAWDLEFEWAVNEQYNQKHPKNPTQFISKVTFHGQFKTTLRLPEGAKTGFKWTNEGDSRAERAVTFSGSKIIRVPKVKDVVREWKLGKDEEVEKNSYAKLHIDPAQGTYELVGSLSFIEIMTFKWVDSPVETQNQHSIDMIAPNDPDRVINFLPSQVSPLTGSADFPVSLGPFSDLDPGTWTKMPTVPGMVPWARAHVTWTLKPTAVPLELIYGSTKTNVEALLWGFKPIDGSTHVGYLSDSDWSIHSNFEGQVKVNSQPQLKIEKAPSFKGPRVSGGYGIRRLARSWGLNEKGERNFDLNDEKRDGEYVLDRGWIYDSPQPLQDWLDQASMGQIHTHPKDWPHKGLLDEFLIGVVDLTQITFNAKDGTVENGEGDKQYLRDLQYLSDDAFMDKVSGMPEFKFVYVAFFIEMKPNQFRIYYWKPRTIDLKKYREIYMNPNPNCDYRAQWGSKSDWMRLVEDAAKTAEEGAARWRVEPVR